MELLCILRYPTSTPVMIRSHATNFSLGWEGSMIGFFHSSERFLQGYSSSEFPKTKDQLEVDLVIMEHLRPLEGRALAREPVTGASELRLKHWTLQQSA